MSYKWKRITAALLGIMMLFVPYSVMAEGADTGSSKDYQYSTGNEHSASQEVSSRTWVQTSDDTWTLDINGDKKTDVTLKSSKNADGNTVWTYTFNVEDNDKAYQVYEEMTGNGTSGPLKSGYTSNGSDDKEAIPQEPGTTDQTTHSYTITNSKDHTSTPESTGSLKLTKNVTGDMSNPAQKFAFTITLSGTTDAQKNAIKGTKIFGSVPFQDGVGRVSLGKGDSAEMTDIPAGVTYMITEDPVEGYEAAEKSGDTGSIAKDTESTAVFTNHSTYTPPEDQGQGSFTLTKSVKGYPDKKDASYTFHVVLTGLVPNGSYKYGTDTYTADDKGTADVTVTLKDKQSVEFAELPAGSSYQVLEDAAEAGSEKAGQYISSYAITESNNNGTIAQATGQNTEKNTSLSTAKETVEKNENAAITFTNNYPAVQNLTVRKLLARKDASGKRETYTDADAQFEMTVSFSNLPEGTTITSDYGKLTADEDGEASKTFQIKADGKDVVFHNVPAGAVYQVTESGNTYSPSYDITTTDTYGNPVSGTVVKKKNASTASGEDFSTEEETVEENQSDTVTFMNENVKVTLPITGQKGIYAGLVIAGVLIAGSCMMIRRKRKN